MVTVYQIKQTVRSTRASAATVPEFAFKQQTHHQAITELEPKPVLILSASVVSLPQAGLLSPEYNSSAKGRDGAPRP
ncbi:hypothetical protein [Nibribacter koreensis]|uniref:Uncharacterized protein n=1 Tax=Nibribacter koreensis TaxID=1084519 RepID=A0ABP8FIJ7_9BACT